MFKLEKTIVAIIFLIVFLLVSASSVVLAVGNVSYCCEKTTSGAWCQNAPQKKCDTQFKQVPTSCDATSYCKLGCCYDSAEGVCMENTPQRVCQDSNGAWSGDSATCDIPQCSLGCCLIGDQAAFVTEQRCKRLSSLYGLEINFRKDIQDEATCIASATSEVKGACVFDQDFTKTCKFTTKKQCLAMNTGNSTAGISNVSFHDGFLCSAPELGTDCSGQKGTTCVEGTDEVYFVDLCGNLANIYDASKTYDKDKEYWTKIYGKADSCGYGKSNADSSTCGNCDYYLGSTCKDYTKTKDKKKPSYGDNICADLSCTYQGQTYQHGETWCAESPGTSSITPDKEKGNPKTENLPGSRYFRLVCYDGDVTVEPCADYRDEVCLQSQINGFKTAGCIVNKWQDCSFQTNQKDCENNDRRDCMWIAGITLNSQQANITKDSKKGACVPKYAPGFNFWDTTTTATGTSAGQGAEQTCSQASTQCVVTFETTSGLLGGGTKQCKSGCECLTQAWKNKMNQACISLGDCGSKVNYIGVMGYYNESTFSTTKAKSDSSS